MGWVVIAALASAWALSLAATFGLGAWWQSSRRPVHPLFGVPMDPPVSSEQREAKKIADVAAHPFWKVSVTAGQVEQLIERIRAEKKGSIVFVDDQFKVETVRGLDGLGPRSVIEASGAWHYKPEHFGKRYIYIDCYQFPAQPSRESVLSKLDAAVSVADYRD